MLTRLNVTFMSFGMLSIRNVVNSYVQKGFVFHEKK